MTTCNILKIPLCNACNAHSISGFGCWIEQFSDMKDWPFDEVKDLFVHLARVNRNNSSFYIYHSMKIHNKDYAERLEKLMVLL